MMKTLLFTILLTLASAVSAQTQPDFKKIFSDLAKTNTITEAIGIREKYLGEMRNLEDFNQLTNLEKLQAGESFFDHYRFQMANFISENVADFINPDRKNDMSIFITKLYPKVKNSNHSFRVAELGLAYVQSCEEFISYTEKTEPSLKKMYIRRYCKKGTNLNSELRSILTAPRTLEAGHWDTINFNDYFYVKKIYLSAEGIRNDAYFDVMVNNDIKGTIYVPGRDPSYVVTVEEYTDSILLRSLSGNARILSVILDIH